MSNRPYSIRRARLVPDLNDPNLYGAWGMIPQGGLLVDHTAQGNDGVPGAASGVEQTILGPMRRYLPNSGAGGSVMGAANVFALNDVTVSFWFRMDAGTAANQWLFNYYFNNDDAWGVRYINTDSIQIYDDIDAADTQRYTTAFQEGKLHCVVGVMDSLENLLYLDGVLIGSGASSSAAWSSFAGTLYHGSRVTVTSSMSGIVGPLLIHNAAKDQDWVTKEYEKGARACQFKTDWGVRQSVGNETAGFLGMQSSPLEILAGTWQMDMDTIEGADTKVGDCIAAGAVSLNNKLYEATPTEAAFGGWRGWVYKGADGNNWQVMPIASDNDRRAGATQNGYQLAINSAESVRVDRITNGAPAGGVIASANGYVTNNTWYEFWLTRRYDGLFSLWIRGGAYTTWTLVGTGTDLTYTVSNYSIWDFDAGDKFAYSDRKGDHCFAKYLGVLAP